jgi:hypothetical protein
LVTVAAVTKGGGINEGRRRRRRVVVVMRVVTTFVLCLFGNKCATNKQCLPNNQIPLHSIPVHSSLNSRIQEFHWNNKTPEWKK